MEEEVGLGMGRPPVVGVVNGVGVRQGVPDDGSVDSSDYGDDGNVGVRHVDSGSDDSDIDVVPIVGRPLRQYYDDSSDDDEPPPSDNDGSVTLMPTVTEASNGNNNQNQIGSGHRSQCSEPAAAPPTRGEDNLVVMENGLADLAISHSGTGLHFQLPGVQWTHIGPPRPNPDNSSFRRIDTRRFRATYGPHCDGSVIVQERLVPDDNDLPELEE
jgi:hypothetical protein